MMMSEDIFFSHLFLKYLFALLYVHINSILSEPQRAAQNTRIEVDVPGSKPEPGNVQNAMMKKKNVAIGGYQIPFLIHFLNRRQCPSPPDIW